MKTKNGQNWYVQDLNNYTSEFLQVIILDLLEELKNYVKLSENEKN